MDAWFFQHAAGLVRTKSGWKEFQVRFPLADFLSHASAEIMTVQGRIRVDWEKDQDHFRLAILVPVGSLAVVVLPRFWKTISLRVDGNPVRWSTREIFGLPESVTGRGEPDCDLEFRMESGSHTMEMVCMKRRS